MDKLKKGREMEQAVMHRWEWRGFTCWQPPRAKWRKKDDGGQDIFGLFDFIAIKPFCPVNLVQVKRKRRTEAEVAFNAIKTFAEAYSAPIAPFLVLWHKERVTEAIEFEAWEYGLTGWWSTGAWSERQGTCTANAMGVA